MNFSPVSLPAVRPVRFGMAQAQSPSDKLENALWDAAKAPQLPVRQAAIDACVAAWDGVKLYGDNSPGDPISNFKASLKGNALPAAQALSKLTEAASDLDEDELKRMTGQILLERGQDEKNRPLKAKARAKAYQIQSDWGVDPD